MWGLLVGAVQVLDVVRDFLFFSFFFEINTFKKTMNPHPGGFAGFVHVAQEVSFLPRGTKQTVHYIGLFGKGICQAVHYIGRKSMVAIGN